MSLLGKVKGAWNSFRKWETGREGERWKGGRKTKGVRIEDRIEEESERRTTSSGTMNAEGREGQ